MKLKKKFQIFMMKKNSDVEKAEIKLYNIKTKRDKNEQEPLLTKKNEKEDEDKNTQENYIY